MSQKAFVVLGGSGVVIDTDGVVRTSVVGIVFAEDGNIEANPFNRDVLGYGNGVAITKASTFAGIKAQAEADIRALHPGPMQIVWLDDKGLL